MLIQGNENKFYTFCDFVKLMNFLFVFHLTEKKSVFVKKTNGENVFFGKFNISDLNVLNFH